MPPSSLPSQQGSPSSTPASRPEYVPETHWNATEGKVKDDKAFASFVNEHVAFKAAQDAARLTLPATAEAYEAKLPADFTPPPGVTFTFNKDDPLIAQAKTMAHGMGISQDNFSKLLGLYAGAQVSSAQQINTGRNAEIAKLGATGPALIDSVSTWLDAKGVPSLKAGMMTAAQVSDFAKLMTAFQSQGTSFNTNGREPPSGERVSAEAYNRMTYTQKKEYATKFPQPEGVH